MSEMEPEIYSTNPDEEEMEEVGNGSDGITVELERDSRKTIEVAKHALVGKIISEKQLNKKTVKEMVQKSWGFPKALHIIDLNINTYLFNFSEATTPRRILDEAPWNILGSLLCLYRWVPELSIHEVNFTFCPFWIQMHGVPLEGFSIANAKKIASMVGKVDEVEDPLVGNKIVRGFLRARVYVNIEKPLITSFRVPRKDFPDTWIWIHYEKLQDYCYSCGLLGHSKKDCRKRMAMAPWNPDRPRYGPGLGVPPLKPVSSIISAMTQNRDEGSESHAQIRESGGMVGRGTAVGRASVPEKGDGTGANTKEKVEQNMAAKYFRESTSLPTQHRANQQARDGMEDDDRIALGKEQRLDGEEVEGSTGKGKEGIEPVGGPLENITRIDLEEGKIRAGLGPMNISDLDLEKEDIGLKEPIILTDMMSPDKPKQVSSEDNQPVCLDMDLSLEEIQKCRQVLKGKDTGEQSRGNTDQSKGKKGKEVII